jgi:hypothetical protein
MAFLDSYGTFAANFLLATQGLDIDTQQPRGFYEINAFGHFTPAPGRLKYYHRLVRIHSHCSLSEF